MQGAGRCFDSVEKNRVFELQLSHLENPTTTLNAKRIRFQLWQVDVEVRFRIPLRKLPQPLLIERNSAGLILFEEWADEMHFFDGLWGTSEKP